METSRTMSGIFMKFMMQKTEEHRMIFVIHSSITVIYDFTESRRTGDQS